jgi:multimeric flavodoxin WrbA
VQREQVGPLRPVGAVLNCTLKPSPEQSHTQGLADIAISVMEANGVSCDLVRAVDLDLPPGVQPDMTEDGFATDGWPDLYQRVMAADIVVVMTPIWLGEESSVCTRVVERLYGNSAILNDAGQYAYYGKVGGCLVTGNEDGAKHCAVIESEFGEVGIDDSLERRGPTPSAPSTRSPPPSVLGPRAVPTAVPDVANRSRFVHRDGGDKADGGHRGP